MAKKGSALLRVIFQLSPASSLKLRCFPSPYVLLQLTSAENCHGKNVIHLLRKLQKLSQRLKYGLPEQTDIHVYELGFNDRFLTQEIRKIIGTFTKKNEVKKAIKQNSERINVLLKDYPSVFQVRLNNL